MDPSSRNTRNEGNPLARLLRSSKAHFGKAPMYDLHGYPTRFQTKSTAQLVWTVPVSLESFIGGLSYHRFWYNTIQEFRKSIQVPKEKGSDVMVSRLPEEILRMIEDIVKDDARHFGDAEAETFTQNLSSSPISVQREILRAKQTEFEEPLDKDTYSTWTGKAQEYMESTFSLSIAPGMTMTGGVFSTDGSSYQRLTHILLCIPWSLLRLPRDDEKHLALYRRIRKPPAPNKTNSIASSLCHEVLRSTGWRTTSNEKVSIVDPEYVTLTEEKTLRINRAICDMRLDVMDHFEFQQPRIIGARKRVGQEGLLHLGSRPRLVPEDEAMKHLVGRLGSLHTNESEYSGSEASEEANTHSLKEQEDPRLMIGPDGQKYYRAYEECRRVWPSVVHAEYGKLWQPQLLLKHQSELRNWDWRRDERVCDEEQDHVPWWYYDNVPAVYHEIDPIEDAS